MHFLNFVYLCSGKIKLESTTSSRLIYLSQYIFISSKSNVWRIHRSVAEGFLYVRIAPPLQGIKQLWSLFSWGKWSDAYARKKDIVVYQEHMAEEEPAVSWAVWCSYLEFDFHPVDL